MEAGITVVATAANVASWKRRPPPPSPRGYEEAEPEDEEVPSICPPAGRETAVIKVMTWNIDAATRGTGDCAFVLPHVLSHDVACLQEVTPAAVEWLSQQVPETYIVLTPQRQGGRAWPHEGHDVAMVINSLSLRLRSCKVRLLESEQQRCVLIATLLCLRSGSTLVVGTTHLESGDCKPHNLRVLQLRSALSLVDGPYSGCSVLAGDLNLRDWESKVAKVMMVSAGERGCSGGGGWGAGGGVGEEEGCEGGLSLERRMDRGGIRATTGIHVRNSALRQSPVSTRTSVRNESVRRWISAH